MASGAWRWYLGKAPWVQLISPVIGENSALFDRLTLRMRLIHHSPIEGFLWMHWSNVKYNRRTDFNVNGARFREERPQLYPIEWEDITIDFRALAEAGPAVRDYPITWQDTLFNLHMTMWGSRDVDNYPTFLEIDSIQLTGAEELARRGNCPPGISRWRWSRPARCSPRPTFSPSERPSAPRTGPTYRAARWATWTAMAMQISWWPGTAT